MYEKTNLPVSTRPTIFLIEEDDNVRPMLKRGLHRDGYRVLVAADVEDAREWVSGIHIHADLVLINPILEARSGKKVKHQSKGAEKKATGKGGVR